MSTMKAFTECDFVRATNAAGISNLNSVGMVGVLCESSTAGTLTITDSPVTAGSRTIVSAMALVAGNWYPIPAHTVGATSITIGGTGSVVVFYNKD